MAELPKNPSGHNYAVVNVSENAHPILGDVYQSIQVAEFTKEQRYVSAHKRHNDSSTQHAWKSSFRTSRWFTRGWTLQELFAPKVVKFFSREGELLGTKEMHANPRDHENPYCCSSGYISASILDRRTNAMA